MKTTYVSRVLQNWKAGLTVALISIPLSLSLAVASGATPEKGLITAVWASGIAALFGGSHYNIIGPAGALTGLLSAYAISFGAASLPVIAVLAGIFILIAYVVRLERYLVLIPRSVMHGFTLGVGLVIGLGQLPFALGLPALPKHEHFLGTVVEIFKHLFMANIPTTILFAIFLGAMFVLLKLVPKIPGAVLITPFGILAGWLTTKNILPSEILLLSERFKDSSLSFTQIAPFSFEMALIVPAASVAFIALLETLISAKIADNITNTKFNSRKEIFGLGLANMFSGFFGGLPASGVFVRTGVNIRSGANHKTAALLNALFVALITGLFYGVFTYLPMAVIAAILIFAAIRMVELAHLKRLYAEARKDLIVALLVAALMIGVDSVVGLLAGTALALLFFVENISEAHFEVTLNNKEKKLTDRLYTGEIERFSEAVDTIVYSIKGELTYINADSHADRIKAKKDLFETIIIRLRELGYVDHDGMEIFEELLEELIKSGKQVYLTSVSPAAIRELEKTKVYKELKSKGHIFQNTRAGLEHLGFTVMQ